MRYSAADKYEIIQLVQNSDLSVRQTFTRFDIHKSTFYNWLRRYQENGVDGLEDKKPMPLAVWNKIFEGHREAIVDLALDKPELSPRELAVSYTDSRSYFVSESTVYRLLKEQDLITSPTYILMQAGDMFQHPTTRVNEMWQADFTYFKIIGWGWYYLSTVLDYSRVTLLPGACVPAWAPVTCLIRLMMLLALPGSMR
jgi:putative transposase